VGETRRYGGKPEVKEMKSPLNIFYSAFICLFLLFSFSAFSQNTDTTGTDDSTQVIAKNMKGFHLGLQAGTFFANKYTANLYNGYGLDVNGNTNDFLNSFLFRRINYDYGGGNGLTDQIAIALKVNPGQWAFNDQSYMPINLKYNVAIQVGLNTRYCFDNRNAVILNFNATKLTVTGNFTIYEPTPTTSGFQGAGNYAAFSIVGGEQRLVTQLGFQRVLGDNDKLNFFIEGGVDMILAKFLRNQAIINNLVIDLTSYYYQPAYGSVRGKELIGLGFGVFAGLGLNLTLGTKYTVQLVYNPSYDQINIGASPKLTFQNSIGLRAYYNF
jgi:hypothetical protein